MTTDTRTDDRAEARAPGDSAEKPTEIPARGWLQIAKRGWAEAQQDQVPLLAAGVAYYTFMALFPGLVALVLLYGLVADPATIADQINSVAGAVPEAARDLIVAQLQSVSTSQSSKAGIGIVVAVLLALWSASGGVSNLVTAISTAYDEKDERSFVKKRLLALALTVGAIIFMIIVLGLVAVVPPLLEAVVGSGPLRWVLEAARWILTVVLVAGALAVLYRLAPDRDAPKMRWVSVGAVVATVLWLLASVGFSVYAGMGSYAKTYGAVAGIVVLLLWLFITAYAILLGAEINAEAEEQTARDTTHGPAQPRGERGAVKADSLPPGSSEPPTEGHDMTELDSTQRAAKDGPAEGSVGAIIKQVSEESSRLIRDELRLAQAEMSVKAKHAGLGLGAFGAAGVLAVFGVAVLLATAILALALVLPAWLAALIVGVVVLAVAGVAAIIGKKQVSEIAPPTPTKTVESVKEDITEIKEAAKR